MKSPSAAYISSMHHHSRGFSRGVRSVILSVCVLNVVTNIGEDPPPRKCRPDPRSLSTNLRAGRRSDTVAADAGRCTSWPPRGDGTGRTYTSGEMFAPVDAGALSRPPKPLENFGWPCWRVVRTIWPPIWVRYWRKRGRKCWNKRLFTYLTFLDIDIVSISGPLPALKEI